MNTLDEMADIIAAVRAGETIECRPLGSDGPWVKCPPESFVGGFANAQYRRVPKPKEVRLRRTIWGWSEVGKDYFEADAKLFREVV